MNIISQLTATLSHGNKECQTTILVQKGVSLELLLGTDVLAELGFYIVDGAGPGPMKELLREKTWELTGNSPKCDLQVDAPSFIPAQVEPSKRTEGNQVVTIKETPKENISQAVTSSPVSATVKLLRGLRLPARYAKVVNFNTGLNAESSKQSLMFEPVQQKLKEYGLQLEPSIVEPQKNTESVCTVGIVIENPNAYPVFLPADQLMGH